MKKEVIEGTNDNYAFFAMLFFGLAIASFAFYFIEENPKGLFLGLGFALFGLIYSLKWFNPTVFIFTDDAIEIHKEREVIYVENKDIEKIGISSTAMRFPGSFISFFSIAYLPNYIFSIFIKLLDPKIKKVGVEFSRNYFGIRLKDPDKFFSNKSKAYKIFKAYEAEMTYFDITTPLEFKVTKLKKALKKHYPKKFIEKQVKV